MKGVFMFIEINAADVQGWFYILASIIGLVVFIRDRMRAGKKLKWDTIRDLVPNIHNVVQRIAKLTSTKKDDKFVELIGKGLRMAGFELLPADEKAVKDLGIGHHQWWKLVRDGVEPVPKALREAEEAVIAADSSDTTVAASGGETPVSGGDPVNP